MLFCLVGLTLPLRAQGLIEKVSPVYIYQFTKYIEWPATASQGDFTIGIVGNSPVFEELEKMAQRLKVGGLRTIIVKKVESTDLAAVQHCQILFLGKTNQAVVKELDKHLHQTPVLVITEGYGMTQRGSLISIYLDEDDEKVKFELSKKHLEQHQFRVSSELLKLAAAVL
jgi:hypothetical protein